jgi:Domain of unknown function (DUF4082)/Abnormal spindle-like microcephaly-assoc'd, ASPM-SPD-2-Hydin/Fibronectin type III domain
VSNSNHVSSSPASVVSKLAFNSTIEPSKRSGLRFWPVKKLSRPGGVYGVFLLALACCMALVAPASGQTTLLSATSVPSLIDSNDVQTVEVGLKFKSDTSGYITAVRFYKAKTNVGTHVGHIWSSTGILLGRAVFTNETASGWQQVNFPTPIPVTANTIYVASYYAPSGHYSADANYFATKGIDNAPLHALENGVSGVNGVYRYTGGFPVNGFESTNYWVDVVFTAQATAANPKLTVSPATLSFGSVAVNSTATGSVTLTSSGTSAVTINSASISGTGFSTVAGTFPTTLSPNQSLTLQLQFKPTTAGAATGALTVSSNSTTGATATVSLSGTGAAANPQLKVSATTLSFGSVAVNSAATGSVTLTSSGTTAVTVSSASISGTGFTIVGGSFPATLNPNQTLTVQLQFKPTASGSATGQLTINSNSTTGSPSVVALSGTATAATSHQVDLTWSAPSTSADPVAGYHVYRAVSGGPTQLMNSSMDAQTTYVDSAVTSGTTYNYNVKSVDSNGVESVSSNQIAVSVP